MDRVEAFTPQALLDLYRRLTPEQRTEFIQLVGNESNAEVLGEFFDALTETERARFMRPLSLHVVGVMRPILIREAIPIVRENPELSEEELVEKISAEYEQTIVELEQGLVLREQHKHKQQRDRKPDPETIRRNVEICDLCNQETMKLSAIARKYGLKLSDLRKIRKSEAKWRQLNSSMGPN